MSVLTRFSLRLGTVVLLAVVLLFGAGVFAATFILMVLGAHVLGLGFDATWGWLYAAVPLFAAWLVGQPVADSTRAHTWALSQLRFLAEPRRLARLEPLREPSRLRIRVQAWQPPASRGTAEGGP